MVRKPRLNNKREFLRRSLCITNQTAYCNYVHCCLQLTECISTYCIKVLTVMVMKSTILWDIMPYSNLKINPFQKLQLIFNELHGVISQKILLLISHKLFWELRCIYSCIVSLTPLPIPQSGTECRMISGHWIVTIVKGTDRDLIWSTSQSFAWRIWRKL
jgi:hypothetical protein